MDFSSSALSILQDFWSLVLVFMELSKVNVAAVAWGLRNCMQVKTWIQKWQPTDCDQKNCPNFFFTWVREVGGGVNADDGCDEWDCGEKDEQESESNLSESHLPPPTFILYQTKVLPIVFAGCANIFWIFLTYPLAFDLAAMSMYSVHLIQNTTLVPCRLAQLSGSLHKLIWSKSVYE